MPTSMEDTNNNFFSKFQIEKEIRARRKKANIGEQEAWMEIAGCTGKKQARKQGEEWGTFPLYINSLYFIFTL